MPAKQRQKVKRMPAPCMDAPAVQALRHQIELKIQHEHLRQSREDHSTVSNELTTFFNLIPDLVCIASPDGYFKRLNPAWEARLGYTLAELLATPFFDLIHPEDRERTQAEIARQTGGHWTTQFINRYRCKDGSYRWLEWTVAPASGPNLLYASARDITARRQVERQQGLLIEVLRILNESSSLHAATDAILAAILRESYVDAVGIRLRQGDDFPYFFQAGFAEDFLATENSLIARTAQGDVCRDANGNPSLECTCGLVLRGQTDPSHPLFTPFGSFWSNDTRPLLDLPPAQDPRLHPRNRCIHAGFNSVALVPIRSSQKIVGLLQLTARRADCFTLDTIRFFEGLGNCIGIALTRKQTTEALQTSQLRYRTLFDTASDAIMTLEPPLWKFTSGNLAALRLFGAQTEADFTSREPWTFSPECQPDGQASSEKARTIIDTAMHEGSILFEWTHRRLNGEEFPATVLLTRTEQDGTRFLQATVRDDTNRKKAEAEMQHLRDQLYHMDRLTRMGEMAAALAHEINQPLTSILGNAQAAELMLAVDPPDWAELRAIQGDVAADAKRAGDVIRRLRAFLKRDTSAREPVASHILILELIRFVRLDVTLQGVVLETRLDESLPELLVDRIQVQEVLLNLIFNAAQAPTAQPDIAQHILITTAPAEDRTGVLTTVRDRGTGFTPEHLAKIFDPYFTTKPDGLGMGLPICRSIIEAHGGRIWAENHPEGGALLSFTLPTKYNGTCGTVGIRPPMVFS